MPVNVMRLELVEEAEGKADFAPPQIALEQVAVLIRRSFLTVAEELHLTSTNCPRHPAFLSDATYAQQLFSSKVQCIGAFEHDICQPDETKLIGFVAIWPLRRGTWELTRLCTAPERRNEGIGRLLMEAAKAQALQQGAKRIHLGIINENETLKRWYMGQGFRAGRQKVIKGQPFTMCAMTCRL